MKSTFMSNYPVVLNLGAKIANNLLTKQGKGTFILARDNLKSKELTLTFINQNSKIERMSFRQVDRGKIQTSDGTKFDDIRSYIKIYGLKQRGNLVKDLINLAKEEAGNNPADISENIKEYGLDPGDKEQRGALIEIAKLVARQMGGRASKYIKNYGFDPKEPEQRKALIEIAKLAAKQDAWGTSLNIDNYGLDSKDKEQAEALIEIAKLAARQNGGGVSQNIKKYGLDSSDKKQRKALIEIAKLAARQSGDGVSVYIKNYGLDPCVKEQREALIEIAKLAARQNGHGASVYIKNYGLDPSVKEQREALIEIAKLAARQSGGGTSQNIKNYSLDPRDKKQRKALIEIAKLAAWQDGEWTSVYIKNYGLDPEDKEQREALIEIAMIAARQDGGGTAKRLGNYQLTLMSKKRDGIKEGIIVKSSAEESIRKIAAHGYFTGRLLENSAPEEMPSYLKSLFLFPKTLDLMKDEKGCKEAALKELEEFYTKQLGDRSPFSSFQFYLKKLEKKKGDERLIVQAICWFAIMSNTLISVDSKWEKEELETLFKQLAGIQDPLLRSEASFLVATDILPSAEKRNLYRSLNKGSSMAMPALCLAALGGNEKKLSSIASSLAKVKSSSKTQPAVKDSFFANLWMKTLLPLIHDISLSLSFKVGLLEAVFKEGKSKKQIQRLLSNLKGLLEFQAQEKLEGFEKATTLLGFLKQKYTEAFQEIIPLSDVKEDKIYHLFQKFRDPETLLKYASSLKKLPDASLLLKELAVCLEKLLDESFPACRYEKSKHLEAVFGSDISLKDGWIKERSAPFAIQLSDGKKALDSGKIILQALDNKHADASHYSQLVDYLRGSPEDKKTVKKSLNGKQDDSSLSLQLALIHLIEDPTDQAFEEVFSKLPKAGDKPYALQFDADIRGLKKQNEQLLKQAKNDELTIVNTDNAVDLFLCGTEVEGSCQTIDGNANFNKCLLSYVVDGKNRLLAIKGPEGKVKARSIIRLLWDEKEKKSVLFLERIYPPSAKKEWREALEQEAFKLAKELKVPLLSTEVGKGDLYPNPVCSLSGKAPYEYVDASDGVTDGEFMITEAHLIKSLSGGKKKKKRIN